MKQLPWIDPLEFGIAFFGVVFFVVVFKVF